MDFEYSAEDQAFRQEVREFLDQNLAADMQEAAKRTTTVFADKDLAMRWQARLVK